MSFLDSEYKSVTEVKVKWGNLEVGKYHINKLVIDLCVFPY